VYVPRKAQELSQKVRDIIREETQLTGCVPSPQEVAEITGVDIDDVHEALVISGAHTPDSLHSPASQDESEVYTLMDVQEDDSEPLEDVYRRARLQEVLSNASPQHQEILNLRLVEGKEKIEIARELGISLSDVAYRLRDALDTLRTH
jgi:RNA polymerase sigma factor (sigma-70 family)